MTGVVWAKDPELPVEPQGGQHQLKKPADMQPAPGGPRIKGIAHPGGMHGGYVDEPYGEQASSDDKKIEEKEADKRVQESGEEIEALIESIREEKEFVDDVFRKKIKPAGEMRMHSLPKPPLKQR